MWGIAWVPVAVAGLPIELQPAASKTATASVEKVSLDRMVSAPEGNGSPR
jgi:hypothetical protein